MHNPSWYFVRMESNKITFPVCFLAWIRVVHAVKKNFLFSSNFFSGKWLRLLPQNKKKFFKKVFLCDKMLNLLELWNLRFKITFSRISENLSQHFQNTSDSGWEPWRHRVFLSTKILNYSHLALLNTWCIFWSTVHAIVLRTSRGTQNVRIDPKFTTHFESDQSDGYIKIFLKISRDSRILYIIGHEC